jgi:hypothetical protein
LPETFRIARAGKVSRSLEDLFCMGKCKKVSLYGPEDFFSMGNVKGLLYRDQKVFPA